MRLSVIIGFILGFGIIIISVITRENVSYFFNASSLAITLGGTLSAVIIHFSPHALKDAAISFWNIFSEKQFNASIIVKNIVDISKRSRKTSFRTILKANTVKKNSFLSKALTLVADGMEAAQVEEILVKDSRSTTDRNRIAERVFNIAGSFAPMFGMMGTVIGLIAMLNRIDTPAKMPAAMGLALVTTLYGLILSALVFKPIAGKIRDKNNIDTKIREIIIEGVLSIQRGENSQLTKERLSIYLD